jgi:hypothetical protein
VKPVKDESQRNPLALKDKYRDIIEELEREEIIVKVTLDTDWANNILLDQQNFKVRPCLDPAYLNQTLKRVNHQTTTIEEILLELSMAKVFTTLDAKHGFWKFVLD